MVQRRNFLKNLVRVIAAPAVVKSSILMPVKNVIIPDGYMLRAIPHPYYANRGYIEMVRITSETLMPSLQQLKASIIMEKEQ